MRFFALFPFLFVGIFAEYQSFDGTGNNLANPNWGSAGQRLLRYNGVSYYGNGLSTLTANLPNPRDISNIVFLSPPVAQQPDSSKGLTDFTTYFGQFLDHDLDHTPSGTTEDISIAIPLGDQWLDSGRFGNQTIPLRRSLYDSNTGTTNPREQLTMVTSFLDGSQIYGSSAARAAALRNGTGGLLKTSPDGKYPPKNIYGFPMDNNARTFPDDQLFFVGDVRGNENPGLLTLHTLFIREHNRLARLFAQQNPSWDDEKLFQEARRFVIAFLQHITLNEYMPVTLGRGLGDYRGYNASTNPGILTEFSTGAFRYGHSEVNTNFLRLTPSYTALSPLILKQTYSNPNVFDLDIDPILRGMSYQSQKQVDRYFVDDLRNYLFGNPGSGGMDLIAINTQRARDHGIPSYTQTRRMFGLSNHTTWSDITSDTAAQQALNTAYNGNIEHCDLYVCGLLEDHTNDANVGSTFAAVIREQYDRIRHADRFWYEIPGRFNDTEMNLIRGTTLSAIIIRNTATVDSLQCFVLAQPDGCYLPGGNVITTGTLDTAVTVPATTGVVEQYDFLVDVGIKSPSHPFYNQGSNNFAFTVNGQEYARLNLTKGRTYKFKNIASTAHSLFISRSDTGSSNGLNICYYAYTNPASCGVNNGGILTFTPPLDNRDYVSQLLTNNVISYACTEHSYMGGIINLVDPPPPTTGQPTTGIPTTSDPTTGQPTTADPTTGVPTTAIPTTSIPTTAEATTGQVSTQYSVTADLSNAPRNALLLYLASVVLYFMLLC